MTSWPEPREPDMITARFGTAHPPELDRGPPGRR
jgi:hypothetical protein